MRADKQVAMMEGKGYMALGDVAARLGVTVYTIYRWVKARKIIGFKAANRWYCLKQSIVDYLGPEAADALGFDGAESKG